MYISQLFSYKEQDIGGGEIDILQLKYPILTSLTQLDINL